MKPNKYQLIVLDDLRSFLARWRLTNNPAAAFNDHWIAKGVSRMRPYHLTATSAPQICTKVPTAGGKTLIGIYALQEILNAMDKRQGEPRVCVWLVPSLSIKDQVLTRFNTAGDGYWLALRKALGHRVSVLSKEELLSGGGKFNAQRVREEVVIAVFTYDSLRTRKVEGRKLYESNSELSSFSADIAVSEPDDSFDSDSLVAALASLQPVVIVDESHNATSELSRESIDRLKPSCVLELTATPRETANIISFVDAMALRDEHMVKLPVVVRNLLDQSAVISHAIDLQKRLEAEAIAEQNNGGTYIRPIVLFQAEPKNKTDSLTFEKLRDQLVKERNIDPSWIKIKTANVDELKKKTCYHQSRGFFLNGSINHYPDFIARTHNGTIVLIETKGEHLKNDDSDTKVELGKLWQDCVGRKFRYIMVFEQTPLDGAVSWQDATEMLNAI